MKKYEVGVKEIWEQMYMVEAESKSEAIEKIKNGEGEVCEYDDALTKDKYKYETKFTECCPHCGSEVELKNIFKKQKCTTCKKMIRPCNICKKLENGFECDFDMKTKKCIIDKMVVYQVINVHGYAGSRYDGDLAIYETKGAAKEHIEYFEENGDDNVFKIKKIYLDYQTYEQLKDLCN